MTVAKQQHAKECERQHQSEGVLMEELGRLLGEFKASARYACPGPAFLTTLIWTSFVPCTWVQLLTSATFRSAKQAR